MSRYRSEDYTAMRESILWILKHVPEQERVEFWRDVNEGATPILINAYNIFSPTPQVILDKFWCDDL